MNKEKFSQDCIYYWENFLDELKAETEFMESFGGGKLLESHLKTIEKVKSHIKSFKG